MVVGSKVTMETTSDVDFIVNCCSLGLGVRRQCVCVCVSLCFAYRLPIQSDQSACALVSIDLLLVMYMHCGSYFFSHFRLIRESMSFIVTVTRHSSSVIGGRQGGGRWKVCVMSWNSYSLTLPAKF